MRWRALSLHVGLASAALLFACNSVLDNQAGELADAAASSVDVDASLPPTDAALPDVSVDAGAGADASEASATDANTTPTCALGEKLCNGACVSITDPLFGCSPTSCVACALDHTSAACSQSGCAVATCEPGYADCNQLAADGCETDLSLPAHCGTCNAKCASSAPYCAPTTTNGFACTDQCPSVAPTLCTGQCVSLAVSIDDCGKCNHVCPSVANGAATCASGQCGFTCEADFHACGSACRSDVDVASCGASCSPCATAANAIATCNGVHCGVQCKTNFGDCDGNAANGCEANLLASTTSCGACGVSCSGRACNGGTCAPPPPPPDAGTDAGTDASADAGVDASPPPVDAAADASPPPDDAATE